MGTIAGTVRDPSGAVVPDAKVTVTETDKGVTYTGSTSSSGEFVVTPLPVGRYRVQVEATGFKTTVVGPLDLNVAQRLPVDVTLQVGQITQQVEVTGAVPLLETQTSDLGQVVNGQQMVTLPLNGRNFAQLALLTAGVGPTEPGARNALTYGFSSNGGRSYQNNFELDGVDNNSNLTDMFNETSYVIQPSVDALQEFKVQTSDYSAEFGRGNGAVVNAALKSGSNEFHGDVYEFLRNDVLDSRNFYDINRGAYKQNQFGATLGGPIRLPGVYDGRDKTFFFVDYEGLRIRQGQTLNGFSPTVAERTGDFTSLIDYGSPITNGGAPVLDCNGTPTYAGELFNTRLTRASAASPTGLCGVPFGYNGSGQPLNQIPASLRDPVAVGMLPLWGIPNISALGYNYVVNPITNQDQNNFDVRIDHNFSTSDKGFVRYSYEKQPSLIPDLYQSTGGYGTNFFSGDQLFFYTNAALSETHLFSPTVVNEFRFGYNRVNARRFQWGYKDNLSAKYGIPGVPYGPEDGGFPQFTFSDVSSLGSPGYLPTVEIQNTFEYNDNLTWVHNRHTFKFGADILPMEFTIFQPAYPRGSVGFGPQFTDNPAAPGTGGSGFASFLLGVPDSGSINNLHNVDYLRNIVGLYVQDDFRVTPKLTLNLGLRYDYFGNVREKFNAQGSYDIGKRTLFVPSGQTAQLTPLLASQIPISRTVGPGLIPQVWDNFAPRVGLAYQLTHRLVIRTGYGIFYNGYENGPWSNPSPGFNPPFFVTQSFNTPCAAPSANPALGPLNCAIPGLSVLSQGFPANSLVDPNTPSLLEMVHLKNPSMQQWHFTVEYQLPSDTLLEVGYAGSKGTHLYAPFYNGNQAAPTANPTIPFDIRRPDPTIDAGITVFDTNGYSAFNALETRLEKRFSHGLSFLVSYTYGHSLDNGSSSNLGAGTQSQRYYLAYPMLDYGNSAFDVRHRLVASYMYQLPFGAGRRWGNRLTGVANQLVGGWQLAGIFTASTGNWFTVSDSNSNFANSDGAQNPDLVGNWKAAPCVPGAYFNTCAFANPPLGSLGNAGSDIVEGPSWNNWDLSLLKGFKISEAKRFEFRAEFFNVLNKANLQIEARAYGSTSAVTMGSPQFGFPTAALAPRLIQFGLKFYF